MTIYQRHIEARADLIAACNGLLDMRAILVNAPPGAPPVLTFDFLAAVLHMLEATREHLIEAREIGIQLPVDHFYCAECGAIVRVDDGGRKEAPDSCTACWRKHVEVADKARETLARETRRGGQ